MITYKRGCMRICFRSFQCRGSVFPASFFIALPCAGLTALIKFLMEEGELQALSDNGYQSILKDNSCWSGFVFLVGFLTVFRTSQAYSRFWDGCTYVHLMRAEWFDACAALISFCKHANADEEAILTFQHILVRLFSLLHAVALADIEDCNSDELREVSAFKYELVDVAGLDLDSLQAVKKSEAKVELVFQWIQQLIVENIKTGVLSIPPPILSRSFQEIANGMVAFHEAYRISYIPFPFPYAQTCECLLMLHWLCTPLVVSQYVTSPWWGALFSFLQVFVYWSLNAIAIQIENPFGQDANDIDAAAMQEEFNRSLRLLLHPATGRTPTLRRDRSSCRSYGTFFDDCQRASLSMVWSGVFLEDEPPTRRSRRGSLASSAGTPPTRRSRRSSVASSAGQSYKRRPSQPAVAAGGGETLAAAGEAVVVEPKVVLDDACARKEPTRIVPPCAVLLRFRGVPKASLVGLPSEVQENASVEGASPSHSEPEDPGNLPSLVDDPAPVLRPPNSVGIEAEAVRQHAADDDDPTVSEQRRNLVSGAVMTWPGSTTRTSLDGWISRLTPITPLGVPSECQAEDLDRFVQQPEHPHKDAAPSGQSEAAHRPQSDTAHRPQSDAGDRPLDRRESHMSVS